MACKLIEEDAVATVSADKHAIWLQHKDVVRAEHMIGQRVAPGFWNVGLATSWGVLCCCSIILQDNQINWWQVWSDCFRISLWGGVGNGKLCLNG